MFATPEETIIYSKRFPRDDFDETEMAKLLREHPPEEPIDTEKAFQEFMNRVNNSTYVVRPDKMAFRKKFIDLAIEYSANYDVDMIIKERAYFIEVTMYCMYGACFEDANKMLSELIGMSDRICSFDGKSGDCDFIITLDYYTHDCYAPE